MYKLLRRTPCGLLRFCWQAEKRTKVRKLKLPETLEKLTLSSIDEEKYSKQKKKPQEDVVG